MAYRIFGQALTTQTDGIVSAYCANLSNYYNISYMNVYYSYSDAELESHRALTKQVYDIMKGLDEPNITSLAYEVEINKTYRGFSTIQQNGYSNDNDYYKFHISEKSDVSINVSDIKTDNLSISIYNYSGTQVGNSVSNDGYSIIKTTSILDIGYYYLKISSTPSSTSYAYSHDFIINSTTHQDVVSSVNKAAISEDYIYPNPCGNILYFGNDLQVNKVEFYSVNGQLVLSKEIETNNVNVESLDNGTYWVRIFSMDGVKEEKVIIKE